MPSKAPKKKTVRKNPVKRAPKNLIPKSYRDQFDKLPEPIRSKAMRNCEERIRSHGQRTLVPESISAALFSGFVWGETPEGRKYWDLVETGNYSVEPEYKPIKFKCSIPEGLCRHSEGPKESFESRLEAIEMEIQKEKEWLDGMENRLADLSRTVEGMLRPWWKFWA